jgi:hypothetical protein
MRSLTIICILFFCSGIAAGPSALFKASNNYYLETQSIARAVESLSSTAKAIAGPMGEAQLNSIGSKFKARYGINFLSKDELRKLGLDISKPIISSGLGSVDDSIETRFIIGIPAIDAKKAVQKLFKILESIKKAQPSKKWVLNENKGGFFEIKTSPGSKSLHLLAPQKGSWIFLGESKSDLTSFLVKGNEKNLESHGFLHDLFKNPKTKKTYSKEFINFYASPSILGDEASVMALLGPGLAGEEATEKIEKEMLENLKGFAANLVISPSEIGFKTGYIYNRGFLDSDKSLFTSMLARRSKPTIIDKNPSKPMILYGLLRMHVKKILEFSIDSSPVIKREYDDFNREFKEALGIDFGNDVLPTLSGSFSLAMHEIPSEENLYNPDFYKVFFSVGLKDNGRDVMNTIIKQLGEEFSKSEEEIKVELLQQKTKSDLWQITYPIERDKSRMPGEPPGPPNQEEDNQVFKLHVLITDSELTIATSRENIDSLKSLNKNLFLESVTNKAYKNAFLYGYINILEIRRYVERSSFGMLVGPYLMFVKNLESLHWDSSIGEESVDTKISIKISLENQL